MAVRVFPAQLHGGDAAFDMAQAAGVRAEGHGVQGGGRVPGTDFPGVDGIVAEVLVGNIPVLVSDQA